MQPFGLAFYEFSYELELTSSNIGEPTHRLVPKGMPRIRKELVDGVLYMHGIHPETGVLEGPVATGCIVSKTQNNCVHYYAVTNHHVITGGGSVIRINTKDGKSRLLMFEPHDWQFLPSNGDVAAVDLTDDIKETDQIFGIPERLFITEDVMSKYEIAAGDDIFMLGMFASAPGIIRNTPAIRFGNLSLLVDSQTLILQGNGDRIPSHLVDMRSRSGFSGSPVFIFRNHLLDLSNLFHFRRDLRGNEDYGFKTGNLHSSPKDHFIGFLGLHCSQFWDEIKMRKSLSEEERKGDPIHEGDKVYVQGGMTVVVPAQKIIELLEMECFAMRRKKREESAMKEPIPESVTLDKGDVNPSHKEDFTALASVAAKKKQPID